MTRKKEDKDRRTKGDGGITWVEKRRAYQGTILLGYDESGKKIKKYFYGKAKGEVVRKMNEFRAVTHGLKVDNSTFRQWSNKWLEMKKKELNPKSYQRYEGLINNYVSKSDFYDTDIKKITTLDLKEFYFAMKDMGASEKTIHYTDLRIGSIFSLAIEAEVLARNPVSKIKMKKPEVSESLIKAWTKEEQKKFTDYITENNHKYRFLYLLALGSGLRLGELLALTWKDLNLKKKTVNVDKTVSRLRQPDKSYKDVITPPKSKSSVRTVPIPETLCKVLEDIPVIEDCPLVFPDPETKSYIYNKNPNRNITYICNEIEIPDITFHHLRSTYATRLFEAGVPLKTVQKLLGHSTLEMTERIYVQVMKESKESAAEQIKDLF